MAHFLQKIFTFPQYCYHTASTLKLLLGYLKISTKSLVKNEYFHHLWWSSMVKNVMNFRDSGLKFLYFFFFAATAIHSFSISALFHVAVATKYHFKHTSTYRWGTYWSTLILVCMCMHAHMNVQTYIFNSACWCLIVFLFCFFFVRALLSKVREQTFSHLHLTTCVPASLLLALFNYSSYYVANCVQLSVSHLFTSIFNGQNCASSCLHLCRWLGVWLGSAATTVGITCQGLTKYERVILHVLYLRS